ncbi:helix-turn-helix domain-containing protein [Streptomyces sp. ID05-26A]|nr:helix-turn-helix domain-containing protein [Streptomyces sp. ID05-26A]
MGSQTTQGLDPDEPLYTLDEIAKPLRVSAVTLRRRIADGELKAFRVGRGWRVKQSERDAYFERIGFLATSHEPQSA